MKGEKHLMEFGFSIIQVKVIREFGAYVKIRHWNSLSDKIIPYYQIVRKQRLIDLEES
jgi:hypothetical protein